MNILQSLTPLLLIAGSASAAVITISTGPLLTSGSTPISATSLLQLVDLGNDGVFNEINIGDGSITGDLQWVTGDDTLLNVGFGSAEFTSTRAFDTFEGAGGVAGLDRTFTIDITGLAGKKLGLRWFPTISAANFLSTTLAAGTTYGQFTRGTGAQYGGELWVVPADNGAFVTFDPLLTIADGGLDANTATVASLTVIPEPASAGLIVLGLAALAARRRRK
jgi:hypothetical protein